MKSFRFALYLQGNALLVSQRHRLLLCASDVVQPSQEVGDLTQHDGEAPGKTGGSCRHGDAILVRIAGPRRRIVVARATKRRRVDENQRVAGGSWKTMRPTRDFIGRLRDGYLGNGKSVQSQYKYTNP